MNTYIHIKLVSNKKIHYVTVLISFLITRNVLYVYIYIYIQFLNEIIIS